MGSLTGALIAAGVAWASILLAAVLPVPQRLFERLRWVGAASIALVGLAMVGVALPAALPVGVLAIGTAAAALWPSRPREGLPPTSSQGASAPSEAPTTGGRMRGNA